MRLLVKQPGKRMRLAADLREMIEGSPVMAVCGHTDPDQTAFPPLFGSVTMWRKSPLFYITPSFLPPIDDEWEL
jgi:hypothetical protein